MNYDNLLKLAKKFELLAIAEKEELPENSKDTKTVLKNIEQLETFSARKQYAEKNLKHLSSGSSRIVYLTKEKTVVKLAKNEKGMAQNKAEANPKLSSKYINKVLSHAKKYEWIEAKYLKKITEKEFKKLTGMEFDDFGECIRYNLRNVSSSKKEKPDCYDKIKDNEMFEELSRIGKKHRLMGGDLARISSWLTNGEHPVLGDSGLTKNIFEEFYEST